MEIRFPDLFGLEEGVPLIAPRPGLPDRTPERTAPRAVRPRLPEGVFETRKYIGVYCNELNAELAEHFGIKEGAGLIVAKLTEDGPAAKAKIRVGDVIVRVDGRRIETVDALIDLVQAMDKGAKVKVELLRDKKPLTVEVEVAEEESGPFGSDTLRDLLESWQGYTDAFRNELKDWSSDELPVLRQSLKSLSVKGLRRI
jgi:hypothetical protein